MKIWWLSGTMNSSHLVTTRLGQNFGIGRTAYFSREKNARQRFDGPETCITVRKH